MAGKEDRLPAQAGRARQARGGPRQNRGAGDPRGTGTGRGERVPVSGPWWALPTPMLRATWSRA